ncbi:DUF6183 family protein [Streptomyces massasporeus]|uniref:DUF6183 family protein n=1 Tax=Streptomyces massasporeus TaxID=67324 RepID=UPI003710A24A
MPSPLSPDDFGISFIKELPLRCLAGEGSRRGSALACATTPDDVLNELFSASYVGGVNGQGQGGAYARLYAWEGFCALMGLPAGVPLLEAVRGAADHRWLRFMAFTDWFHHDTPDVAFAVLDPTRTRVAVLAVSSGAHESFLNDLGADRFIDCIKGRPEELVQDVDLDAVGGPGSSRFLRTLKRGGSQFHVLPGAFDEEEAAALGVTVSSAQVRSSGAQLVALERLLDTGVVRVAIDSTFALADARAAHERAARGRIQGKIVLTVRPADHLRPPSLMSGKTAYGHPAVSGISMTFTSAGAAARAAVVTPMSGRLLEVRYGAFTRVLER